MRIKTDGFTILEILIVVIIIAIGAMIAVPLASSAAGVQVGSAANMIAADLEYAKSMAITRGQNFSVVFEGAADSYRIEDQNGNVIPHPVKKGFDYVIDFHSDGRLDKVDISNVDFNSTSRVTFDCLGSPDNGGAVTVQAGGNILTVAVEPVTGFITIQD
ncbi:MAG: GspH/FimT family protein [Planctomycetota bacterium]